jgi:hypothetical protein
MPHHDRPIEAVVVEQVCEIVAVRLEAITRVGLVAVHAREGHRR